MKKIFKCSIIMVAMIAMLAFCPNLTVANAASQVTGLKQTNGYETSVTISWDAYVGAKGYLIDYSSDGKTWTNYGTSNSASDYISGLSAGQSYYVRVCALSSTSSKTKLGSYSATFEVVTAPEMLGSDEVIQTKATATSATMSWPATIGATGYEIYKESKSSTCLATVTTNSYTVSMTNGTYAYMYVCPVRKSASGYVASSDYKTVTVYTAPGVTKGVTVDWEPIKNNNKVEIAVQYDSASYAHGYQFKLMTLKGKVIKTYTINKMSSYSSTLSFKNSKITNTGFKYQVRLYRTINNTKQYGNWSKVKVAIPQAKMVKGDYYIEGSSTKVSWKKVTGAKKYIVYVSKNKSLSFTKPKSEFKKVATLGKNKTSYTITGLAKSKYTYVYVVPVVKVGNKKYTGTYCECLYFYRIS